jgi:hypothetical protein
MMRRCTLLPFSAASMRNTYSIICTEFASRGFVVAAVEHADGTACCTEVSADHWRDWLFWLWYTTGVAAAVDAARG